MAACAALTSVVTPLRRVMALPRYLPYNQRNGNMWRRGSSNGGAKAYVAI